MKNWRIIDKILDVFQLYIPAITFIVLFIVFVVQIISRYIFNTPLTWAYELTQAAFIWTTLLAASYMHRKWKHIEFAMIYDKLSSKGKSVFSFIGNSIIALACALSFFPTLSYICFIHTDKSPLLRIPFSYIMGPILLFLLFVFLQSVFNIFISFKEIFMNGEKNK
jgi:TRAP-type C4-dicarboxylate transport system permease small subunit